MKKKLFKLRIKEKKSFSFELCTVEDLSIPTPYTLSRQQSAGKRFYPYIVDQAIYQDFLWPGNWNT